MARNSAQPLAVSVGVNGMISALTDEATGIGLKMADEIVPFHSSGNADRDLLADDAVVPDLLA